MKHTCSCTCNEGFCSEGSVLSGFGGFEFCCIPELDIMLRSLIWFWGEKKRKKININIWVLVHVYPLYIWNTDDVQSTDFCKTLWNSEILGNKNHTKTPRIWYALIKLLLFIITRKTKRKYNWLYTFSPRKKIIMLKENEMNWWKKRWV